MEEKLNGIVKVVGYYTEQIERYESISTWFAAFAISCILAVITIAVTLLIRREKENGHGREIYNIIMAGIFLIIPSITTLYLYVFAMNMRKVALYRGYLGFLEEKWNSLAEENVMLFDAGIMGQYFSLKSFWVNGLGPAVMAVFVVVSLVIGFGLSIYFVRKVKASSFKNGLKLFVCLLMVLCVLFDGVCVYYLSTNESVTASVADYCEES